MQFSYIKFNLKNNNKVLFQIPDDLNSIGRGKTVLVNGSGVDIDKFYNTKPQTENISFLIMARLLKIKGIKQYIEAARIIRRDYPEVEFNIWIGYN